MSSSTEEVLDFVRKNGFCSSFEIQKQTETESSTLQGILSEFHSQGQIFLFDEVVCSKEWMEDHYIALPSPETTTIMSNLTPQNKRRRMTPGRKPFKSPVRLVQQQKEVSKKDPQLHELEKELERLQAMEKRVQQESISDLCQRTEKWKRAAQEALIAFQELLPQNPSSEEILGHHQIPLSLLDLEPSD